MCARKLKYSSGDELPVSMVSAGTTNTRRLTQQQLFATPEEAMREGNRQEEERRRRQAAEYQANKYGAGYGGGPGDGGGGGGRMYEQGGYAAGGAYGGRMPQNQYGYGGYQGGARPGAPAGPARTGYSGSSGSATPMAVPQQQYPRPDNSFVNHSPTRMGNTRPQSQPQPHAQPPIQQQRPLSQVYSQSPAMGPGHAPAPMPPSGQMGPGGPMTAPSMQNNAPVHSMPHSVGHSAPQSHQSSMGHTAPQSHQSSMGNSAVQGHPAPMGHGMGPIQSHSSSQSHGTSRTHSSSPGHGVGQLQGNPPRGPQVPPAMQGHGKPIPPGSQGYNVPTRPQPAQLPHPHHTQAKPATVSNEDPDALTAKKLFMNHDVRKMERLTAEELQHLLQNDDNSQFCMSSVDALISLFGATRFGTVNLSEFTSLYKRVKKWRMIYVDNDINGSFTLSATEFHNSLQELGYLVPFEVSEKLFDQYAEFMNNQNSKELKFDKFVESLVWLMRLTKVFRNYDEHQDGIATIHFKDFIDTSLYLGKFLPR
ncbi:AaceriAFR570Wp [[Ashbya] aceris (nom. inval.)]|nr:AaceriAFR570Wp [[Ashbya] aceris (nom. inval.)]